MTTIIFSQNNPHWSACDLANRNNAPCHVLRVALLNDYPVQYRCREYEQILTEHPDGVYYTVDEHFVLVALWMRRKGLLERLSLVSCEISEQGAGLVQSLEVDDEGEISDDVRGGFFTQRMKYLFD